MTSNKKNWGVDNFTRVVVIGTGLFFLFFLLLTLNGMRRPCRVRHSGRVVVIPFLRNATAEQRCYIRLDETVSYDKRKKVRNQLGIHYQHICKDATKRT